MTPQIVPQILATDDNIVASKSGVHNNYEAKLLFIVLFGFGAIDAIMRCGLERA